MAKYGPKRHKMIGIRLEQQMDCGKICKIAENTIKNYIQENGNSPDLMLVMQVKRVVDGHMDKFKKLTFTES